MTAITKYFIGGELEAFVAGSHASTAWTATAGRYDSDFSRGGVRLQTTSDTSYINVPLTSPQLEFYVGLIHFLDSGSINGPPTKTWFSFVNTSATQLFRVIGIGGTFAQPILQFQYYNGSAWTAIGTGFVVPIDIIHKWDFEFSIANSGGFARCYVDGILLGELTGDTLYGSPSEIAEMRVHTPATGGTNSAATISEVQILDVSTLGRRLATLNITADGATTDWTGTYADIDDVGVYSDTEINDSATADQVSTFVTTDLSVVAQTYLVDSVVLAYRAQIGGTGPQNLKGVVRIGGVDYPSAGNVDGPNGLVTAMGYVWADFPENPDTTANFTPAEINTAGFETGFKSIT